MAPFLIPMPVPVQARPCVIVEGARYCRQDAISPAYAGGIALLASAALIAWLLLLIRLDRGGRHWLAASLFFGPLVTIGCALLIWGGR